jgi:alginate O-acetyltransferase complex protein AlgI
VVFSSHLFVYYFLPLVLAAYFLAPRRAQNLVLTLFSFVFYGWANVAFIPLLMTSTLIDYLCGLGLTGGFRRPWRGELPLLEPGGPRSRAQKTILTVSITANLLLLGFFKYFNFSVDSYNAVVAAFGFTGLRLDSVMRVVLPLGISFYTFKSMSYAIDVYRGDARAMRDLLDFFCFESMFPDLVAGPIIRFSEIADQLAHRTITSEKFARGVSFFCLGMAKKVLLANPCGRIADTTFGAASLGALDAWQGLFAYAFQIYFDFSGYSDMAIGLALMLGFMFPKNFDSPYKAESITDFWRRWHLSLSTWLRDYLYIPLGGNRKGETRTYINLVLVMLIGGLWHGAAWTFVIWGAIHGGWLALERALGKDSWYRRLPHVGRVALTFFIVLIAWVFFRAPDLGSALRYLGSMTGGMAAQPGASLIGGLIRRPYDLINLALAAAIAWFAPQTWDWTRRLTWPKGIACLALLGLALAAMATQGYNPFIYFIF